MILVMYHPVLDELRLWEPNDVTWQGPDWLVWQHLTGCLGYGWEVIGEL